MFYYAHAALQRSRRPVVFSVPSGNFGNLTAGLLAWRLGAPIAQLRRRDDGQRHGAALSRDAAATSRAPSVADARQRDGRRRSRATSSACAGCSTTTSRAMRAMIAASVHTRRRRAADDPASCATRYGYRRAIRTRRSAISGSTAFDATPTRRSVFLATAHPAKFREMVEPVIGAPRSAAARAGRGAGRPRIVQRSRPQLTSACAESAAVRAAVQSRAGLGRHEIGDRSALAARWSRANSAFERPRSHRAS